MLSLMRTPVVEIHQQHPMLQCFHLSPLCPPDQFRGHFIWATCHSVIPGPLQACQKWYLQRLLHTIPTHLTIRGMVQSATVSLSSGASAPTSLASRTDSLWIQIARTSLYTVFSAVGTITATGKALLSWICYCGSTGGRHWCYSSSPDSTRYVGYSTLHCKWHRCCKPLHPSKQLQDRGYDGGYDRVYFRR